MTLSKYFRRKWWDAERAREIDAYLEIETAENIGRGMASAEAAASARRKLGNSVLIREEIYTMNTIGWLESLWQDFRYGARLLRLNAGFTLVATLSLVLGIGANAAIFQLLDALRLRLLPVAHPEQLAELQTTRPVHCCGGFYGFNAKFTYPQWAQIRARQQAFSSLFAWGDARFNMAEGGEARYAAGLWVGGDFFRTLGISPVLGRLIDSADDVPGCGSPGVVLGYSFWQGQFGGDPRVMGKSISLDRHHLRIAGVAPAGFSGVEVGKSFDVAVPVCAEPVIAGENSHMQKRDHWWLAIMGRLKPGWTLARAAAQANAISPAVFETTVPPAYRPEQIKNYTAIRLTAAPAGSGVSRMRVTYENPLHMLLAIAGLVLLIACANLANLMLARASAREREISVRLAIGASRGRLIRQLLAESMLLTLFGVVGGVVLSQLLSRYLLSFLNTVGDPLFLELQPDWRVLIFTASAGILTCVCFGLCPALKATRAAPVNAMKAGGRGITAGREKFGLRRVLVVSQVSLSMVLLVGALLFVRSLRNLLTLDAGFREDGLLIASLDISRLDDSAERRPVFYRNLLDRVRAVPGIQDAAIVTIVPVAGYGWNDFIEIVGQPARSEKDRFVPWLNGVSPGYFRTMGTALLEGRDFNDRDTPASPEVAIVNEKFRAKYLGGADPIGKRFRMVHGPGEDQPVYQIVGLVRDSKYGSLREDFEPTAFFAESQNKQSGLGMNVIVRSSAPLGSPLGSLLPALKRTILSVSPGISLQFQVFKTQIRESLLRERLMATLSGFFGFLAAVLATIGIYGVISYMVARRRNEIGIRIALGAGRGNVLRLVMKEAGMLLVAGLVTGIALSIAAGRAATSLLYGLQPWDPVTIALAVALLAAVALIASGIPALRAARLNPMAALREE